MVKPLIIINFKTYQQSIGKKGLKLAQICEQVAKKYKANIIICPQEPDLALFSKKFKISIYAQHLDPFEPGKLTGFITPAEAKAEGVKGTLINHSEHPLKLKDIKILIKLCKKYKLTSVVCIPNLKTLNQVKKLKPDYIAYEPPALIGGKISVTQAKPEIIKKAVKATKVKILVGAGVKSHQDLKTALKLKAKGVLVASDIVKAKNPRKELTELIGH
ncbi:triose-phosphate isomerase [Candidatus Woesearchaeota archaeon]|nr:triose-phosphate isomerase [Candidatus Woesearchaeota archaeon]